MGKVCVQTRNWIVRLPNPVKVLHIHNPVYPPPQVSLNWNDLLSLEPLLRNAELLSLWLPVYTWHCSILIRSFVRENLLPCKNPQTPVTNYLWIRMLPSCLNDIAVFWLYLMILCDISMCISFIIEEGNLYAFFSGKKQNSPPQKIDLGWKLSPILGK